MSQIQSFSLKDKAGVRDVVFRSMEHDPCACYIARNDHVPQVFDGLMSPYWSSQPIKLHLMTEGCKSVVFARFHPSEEVSGFSTFLRDVRVASHIKLVKLMASLRTGARIEKGKAHFARECGSYIYVYIMGTLPEYQNRGLGSTLLSHISTIADSKGLPCYLESSSEDSRRFYERHGYSVRDTLYIDKGSPPLYLMSRPMKPSVSRETARSQT